MACCFVLDETPQAGLRRIAREQAKRAVTCLSADHEQAATVHESRKCLKRLRALLKLVRHSLPKPTYKREYNVIRDVGRSLSGERDFDVMPVTLATLGDSSAVCEAGDAVRGAIERARKKRVAGADRRDLLSIAAKDLDTAAARYGKLRLDENSFAVLDDGIGDGLRLLRRQHAAAVASGESDAYHDWRKSVQLHWRHPRLVSAAWPALVEQRIRAMKSLANVLGLDHDLSVLAKFVKKLQRSGLSAARRKAVCCAIGERQEVLRAEARALAGLLVVDRPKRFVARLRTHRDARMAFDRLDHPLTNPFLPGSDE